MKYIDILKNLNIKLTDDKKFQMLKVKILDEFNYINITMNILAQNSFMILGFLMMVIIL